MPILFNSLLKQIDINPVDVALIRHKDTRAAKNKNPYELWRDDRKQFDLYQSIQNNKKRKIFQSKYWAVFVANHMNETLFTGIYTSNYIGENTTDIPKPHMPGQFDLAYTCDMYALILTSHLEDLIGRLFIDWGDGALAYVQYARKHDKPITKLLENESEIAFPGYASFIESLSALPSIPKSWIAALSNAKGVYLLTCPATKELYVGSASGSDGFWGRWKYYVANGHGGNEGMKSRNPTDYQISILEVSGSMSSDEDIKLSEGKWQCKLQSAEMGLNRNISHKTQVSYR